MKTCSKCKRELNDEDFHIDNRVKSHVGRRSICKECNAIKVKEWRDANPDKQSAISKKAYGTTEGRRLYCNGAIQNKKRDKRGFKVSLTFKELYDMTLATTHCPICGVQIDYSRGKGGLKHNSPSMDRIDNGMIVSKDTVWIICSRCNTTKHDRSMKEFKDYCAMVVSKDF